MPFRFAVDLGTSNTVAVVDRGDGTPRPLLFDGSPMLPSAVFADRAGALLVGRDAERHMMTDAARFEPNPKGRIDEGAILLGDREVPVADLLAAVLRRAATEAAQTGVPVAGASVLTCPVDWGNTRRAVLLDAAARAGLGRVALLDEPVSAATYCVRALGGRLAPARCAVVFDFGGGTLDVTVVEAAPAGLRVLATGGLADLGGTDIDAALVGHLGHLVATGDPGLWQRLAAPRTPGEFRDRRTFWSEVRQAKEMLARTSSAPVHIPGSDRGVHLTREELDRIAGPLVDRAVDETRRVLDRSGVTPARLDAIVLVGGSSRLPLVASRLHARFGLAPVVPEQPELPVAFGALLLANGPGRPPARSARPPAIRVRSRPGSVPLRPVLVRLPSVTVRLRPPLVSARPPAGSVRAPLVSVRAAAVSVRVRMVLVRAAAGLVRVRMVLVRVAVGSVWAVTVLVRGPAGRPRTVPRPAPSTARPHRVGLRPPRVPCTVIPGRAPPRSAPIPPGFRTRRGRGAYRMRRKRRRSAVPGRRSSSGRA
ncbi:Hsp70 family protein [Dactylosporangium sp. NPDC051485]|uniref:Hsp70 family protein n=1 Tax=Dactylosporangium sp. NPDC051485 TaxID=3154846 RepID=UPI003439AC2C